MNRSKKDIIKYFESLEEVEGVLLTSVNNESVITLVCFTKPNNFVFNNFKVIVNYSKDYNEYLPSYYNEKLLNSKIVFDRNSRLTSIKKDMLSKGRKLTI